ncbi:prepilin-type N-terminal cleavage/methylation domain-containing protein [Clostridium perfringens]
MNTKKQNKKKKGFTLIELIIVIAIIAILAAIAIPNFLGIQRKSKIKADIASAKTIYDAAAAGISEGTIKPINGTETFTFTAAEGKNPAKIAEGKNPAKIAEVDNVSGEAASPADNEKTDTENVKALKNNLQTIPSPKFKGTNFVLTIESNSDLVKPTIKVAIKDGSKSIAVYPDGQDEYAINNTTGKSTAPASE